MKIALVGPTYPHRGGIAHYTSLLASHLEQQHLTRVYSFRSLYPARLFPGRSQLDPSPSPLTAIESRRWLVPWWPLSWLRVQRDWQAWRPDKIVMQWWVPFMAPMTAWLAGSARRLGAETVMLCHNILPHERRWLDETLIRMALSRADRLVVHNSEEQSRARGLLPGRRVDVAHLPSYTGFKTASPQESRARLGVQGNVLLFFGFVRPYKGVLDLIDALPAVAAEVDATLLVVGEIWGGAQPYQARVAELGLESRVRFVDRYVTNEEAAEYFGAADLVVLPYREATGSAVLQLAFAQGVPVIATRTGGMAEVVEDGQTGYLVHPGDVEGLSRSIVRYFAESQATEFRANIQRRRAQFDWQRLVDLIIADASERARLGGDHRLYTR